MKSRATDSRNVYILQALIPVLLDVLHYEVWPWVTTHVLCHCVDQLWTFSAMTSKRKNGGYSVGTFVQKVAKIELIR